jgi:hypothetical protein
MKTIKRIACSILALVMVIGLTACTQQKFDHKKIAKYCDDQNYESYDDFDDFIDEYSSIISGMKIEDGSYIYVTDRDAQKIYNKTVNRFSDFPKYDVNAATCFAINDDGINVGWLFDFADQDDAEKFFKKAGKRYAGDGEKGEEKGYSYYISEDKNSSGGKTLSGVYRRGNTVLLLRTISKDTDVIEDFCEYYGVISPTEA